MAIVNDDKYSRNQCSLVIRVDGEEIEVPVNFGMTPEEIKTLYPFLLPLANSKIKSPAVELAEKAKAGAFEDVSEEDYEAIMKKNRLQSKFWFDKTEASLLDIAVRFAVDIKLRGIEELADMFDEPLPAENIKTEPITEDEAQQIIQSMGLETATDYEHDPGDEQDIPLGIGGNLNVNLYDSGDEEDYLSAELDAMESKLDVEDKFTKIVDNDLADVDEEKYASGYKSGAYDSARVKDGLLDMYADDNASKSIFDKMDEDDGLIIADDDDEEDDDDMNDDLDEDFDDEELDEEYADDEDISFDDDDGDEGSEDDFEDDDWEEDDDDRKDEE